MTVHYIKRQPSKQLIERVQRLRDIELALSGLGSLSGGSECVASVSLVLEYLVQDLEVVVSDLESLTGAGPGG